MPDSVKFEPFGALDINPGKPMQPAPATAPIPKPLDFRNTNTTRLLSAASYLTPFFCDRVYQQVINEKHRAIIAAYGVDMATVAGHAMLARRRKKVRDGLIFALVILSLVAFGMVEDPAPLFFIQFLIFLTTWGITAFDSYTVRYRILGSNFTKKRFNPDQAFSQLNADEQKKLKEIASLQQGNVVVYGGFSPFVGSGIDLGGWSFATKLNKGKEEHGEILTPLPFQVEEFHDALNRSLFSLGMEGVSIEDSLYVDGQEIRDDTTFLPHPLGRPVASVDPVLVRRFMEHPTPAVRHYKCIQTIGWKGELVLSVFVRFFKNKNSLFTEASYCILPPLQEHFHGLDALNPNLTLTAMIELVMRATLKTPFMLFYSPIVTIARILSPLAEWQHEREAKKLIKENPAFNYGAVTSIRESATSDKYRRYFQKLDKEMNIKIIERQLLDCIVEFLDNRNIDTSDLRERKETILNYGVMVSGGSVQAQSLAVGNQAKAQVGRLKEALGGFSTLKMPLAKGQSE